MKNLLLKHAASAALLFAFLNTPAFADDSICKVRSMGGGTFGISFTFWQQVSANSLEECQEVAAALLEETEVAEDPAFPSSRHVYYRPWKVWYKWTSNGETIKGSYSN